MNEELKQGLLGYIAACEENIQKYREMCDLAAVKAAEPPIDPRCGFCVSLIPKAIPKRARHCYLLSLPPCVRIG